MIKLISLVFLLLPFGAQAFNKKPEMADKTYDANIKTVQLYPLENTSYPELIPSVIPFAQTLPLQLSFDELYYDFTDYYFKIFHCNADWKQSVLSDLEFLNEFNDFPIRDYDYSQNTKIPYTHYKALLPRVKIPGNFVVAVYRKDGNQELVLSRRFVVYDNAVEIRMASGIATAMANRYNNQQIEFEVYYRSLETFSPLLDFQIAIRQNQRWDNMIFALKPSMLHETQKMMEFRHINNENAFEGGNEFRFFDLRTHSFRGQNVAQIIKTPDVNKAILHTNSSRSGQAYSIYNDQNGLYFNQTLEAGANISEADYIEVHFSLEAPPMKEKLYVIGSFNMWARDKNNLMVYDQRNGVYKTSMLLKQGFYDFIYWVEGKSPYMFEGSYFETRNQYEILVYYRKPGTLFDVPVGYHSFYTGVY